MSRRRGPRGFGIGSFIAALLAGALLAALVLLRDGVSDYGTIRYLWTVDVDVDGVRKSGSAVIALRQRQEIMQGDHAHEIFGISPIIDLGPRGVLIALLNVSGGDATSTGILGLIRQTFIPEPGYRARWSGEEIYSFLSRAEPLPLPPRHIPGFGFVPAGGSKPEQAVVLRLDQSKATAGADIRYRGMRIERTELPVTFETPPSVRWVEELMEQLKQNPRSQAAQLSAYHWIARLPIHR